MSKGKIAITVIFSILGFFCIGGLLIACLVICLLLGLRILQKRSNRVKEELPTIKNQIGDSEVKINKEFKHTRTAKWLEEIDHPTTKHNKVQNL